MQAMDKYRQVAAMDADDLVSQHAPLVNRIARHLAARLPGHVLVEDLIQCGMVRLLEAASDYDPGKNASFATYAGIRIRGAMMDEVRANAWAPRSVHRRSRDITETMQRLRNELGREAEPAEIAAALDISVADYFKALDSVSRGNLLSLDEVLSRDTGASAEPQEHSPGPAEQLGRTEIAQRLAGAVSSLSEREQHVVQLYYVEELNLREIGEVLGVSESRVCQIHAQLLLRLRARLEDA